MRVLKPRSRLLSFRVSEEEYDDVKYACLMLGARSVSDFARGAVLGIAGQRSRVQAKAVSSAATPEVDQVVGNLNREVQRLAHLIEDLVDGRRQAPDRPVPLNQGKTKAATSAWGVVNEPEH